MFNESKIILLQLRKVKKTCSFLSQVSGQFLTKGGKRASTEAKRLQKQFYQDAKKFNWKVPPRAKVAVCFSFFSNQKNTAEIYNLVKYYLDLLKGPVFNDDRQVHYLEASIWRDGSSKSGSLLFISVQRFSDFNLKLDLFQGCDDADEDEGKRLSIFQHLIEKQYWDIAEIQSAILSNAKISKYDRPGLKTHTLPTMMQRFNGIDPFIFDFGRPPEKDGSKIFRDNIGTLISNFRASIKLFDSLYIPLELDVQITQKGLILHKDLDNIMIDLCTEVRKQLLHKNIYINGYRIYVVDTIDPSIDADIQLRFLPAGEIMAYNNRLKKALYSLEKTLEDDTRRFS